MRKTFGRVTGSMICFPPSKTTPPVPVRDPPRRVDARALVDDGDRALSDCAPHVRDGTRRGERRVHRRHPQLIDLAADADAARVHLAGGEPRAVLDRPAEVRRARERCVDDDRQRRAVRRLRGAAAARQHQHGEAEKEDGAAHGGPV
jgi:hypothetical protein